MGKNLYTLFITNVSYCQPRLSFFLDTFEGFEGKASTSCIQVERENNRHVLLLYGLLGLGWIAVYWHPYSSGIVREAPRVGVGRLL